MKNWGNFEGTTLFKREPINTKSISKSFANKVVNSRVIINKSNKEQYKEEMAFVNDFEKGSVRAQSLKEMEDSAIADLN